MTYQYNIGVLIISCGVLFYRLPVSLAANTDFTGNVGFAYAGYAASIKEMLLADYSKTTPAVNKNRVVNDSKSMAGTDVYIQFRFFKIVAVSSREGKMDVKVWYRLTWKDERLSWNASKYGGVNHVTMFASPDASAELSDIWVPDVQLYNSLESTQLLGTNALAMVYSDGSVFWSRPGILRPLCKFSGLVAFPFDTLRCDMEMGGWAWSGFHQGIYPRDGGYAVFSDAEATAGSSYQEFAIVRVDSSTSVFEYDCCPGEPWPIVRISVYMKRADTYYSFKMLLPFMLLSIMSMMASFLSPETGERLGYGITLILVVVTLDLVYAAYLPVCNELLWFYYFHTFNLSFCCVALIETCVVLFLSFHESETLVPEWVLNIFVSQSNPAHDIRSAAADAFLSYREPVAVQQAQHMQPITKADAERLMKFEHIFDVLDKNDDERIDVQDVRAWFSYVAMRMEEHEREQQLREYAVDISHFPSGKGFFREGFISMCMKALWQVPLEEVSDATHNYSARLKSLTTRNILYWKDIAKSVDMRARVLMPIIYVLGTMLIFSLKLEDDFADGGSEDFVSLDTGFAVKCLIVLLVLFILIAFGVLFRRRAMQRVQHMLKERAMMTKQRFQHMLKDSEGAERSVLKEEGQEGVLKKRRDSEREEETERVLRESGTASTMESEAASSSIMPSSSVMPSSETIVEQPPESPSSGDAETFRRPSKVSPTTPPSSVTDLSSLHPMKISAPEDQGDSPHGHI